MNLKLTLISSFCITNFCHIYADYLNLGYEFSCIPVLYLVG